MAAKRNQTNNWVSFDYQPNMISTALSYCR